jgi:DNA-binding transcriptional ArsR family regulator
VYDVVLRHAKGLGGDLFRRAEEFWCPAPVVNYSTAIVEVLTPRRWAALCDLLGASSVQLVRLMATQKGKAAEFVEGALQYLQEAGLVELRRHSTGRQWRLSDRAIQSDPSYFDNMSQPSAGPARLPTSMLIHR